MEAGVAPRSFDRLRVHSIGLPQVLFQSITHMAPAAAVAYSIYISVPFSRQALALSAAGAGCLPLCGDRDRPTRQARAFGGWPLRLRGPLARTVGRIQCGLAFHPLRATSRAV